MRCIRLKEGKGIRVFSKPDKLKEWLEANGLTVADRAALITDAGTLVPNFSLGIDEVEFFCHSPFVKHVDGKEVLRNEASLIFQVRFVVGGTRFDYFALGDSTHEVLSDIVDITNYHNNGDRLDWDLYNIPHHCSYLALGPEKGETKTTPADKVAELMEHGQQDAYIVSSSKPIGGVASSTAKHTFLIVRIPLAREAGGEAERITPMGFVAEANIGDLGVATGALDKIDGSYVAVPLLAGAAGTREEWRQIAITPLSVIDAFTPKLARQVCGIGDEGPVGIFAGVGALGSKMLDLWTRSGWGRWTVLDPDHVKPHNLARHIALELHVGHRKSDVAVNLAALLYPGQPKTACALAVAATAADSAELGAALDAADLVIDITTTLAFPRTLASRDTVTRAVSAFISPSGEDAVMLLEDAERTIRLDVLEAQYYRHVIGAPWGATHLAGNQGHLWTGAGCRDVSAVIPNELIVLHGANPARMVRVLTAAPEARLLVWHSDPATGAVVSNSYTPAAPHTSMLDGLSVIWDAATEAKLRAEREARLPNETGGVLLGYFDLVLRKVFIVDALGAPADSQEAPTGFVRGVAGLEARSGKRAAAPVMSSAMWVNGIAIRAITPLPRAGTT